MSKKLFQQSTENLRKAVPLMIKNQVPTTPTNYALWYTYVDNSLPQMNKELDQTIGDYGMCPPAAGENLYRTYVASKTETDIRLRAETGDFRPNIRNTRAEAIARIDEMKRGED